MATKLDMAEQQFYGWQCAHSGERIESLVNGMGLSKKEWEALKKENRVDYLPDYVKKEIDTHFIKGWHTLIHADQNYQLNIGEQVYIKEELTELDLILDLLNKDPHQFGARPCQTCKTISAIANRPFGCELRGKKRKESE